MKWSDEKPKTTRNEKILFVVLLIVMSCVIATIKLVYAKCVYDDVSCAFADCVKVKP